MAVLGTSVQYQRPELINAVSSAAVNEEFCFFGRNDFS